MNPVHSLMTTESSFVIQGLNPYPADKYFDQIERLPTLTKVLLSNFFGTLPTVTNVTEVTFS